MKIRQKLILGFSGVAFLILIVVSLSIISLRNIRAVFTEIEEDIMPGAIAMLEMDNADSDIQHTTLEYVIHKEDRDILQQAMQALRQSEQKHLEHEKHIGDKEGKAAQELDLKIEKGNFIAAEIVNMKDSGVGIEQLLEKDDQELHPAVHELDKILNAHKLIHLEKLRKAEAEASQIQTRVTTIILILGILIFCLAIGVGYFISISISRPIMQLKDAAAEIGKGKLGAKVAIKSKDEIGMLAASFNKMSSDLQNNQEEIQTQKEELNTSNEELKSANEKMAATNEELKQANEGLESTTEEARAANDEAQKAKEVAEKKAVDLERFNKVAVGRELMMKELKERIAELQQKLKEKS